MGIPAPPQERLEGEGAHSPPSDTIILQLTTPTKTTPENPENQCKNARQQQDKM